MAALRKHIRQFIRIERIWLSMPLTTGAHGSLRGALAIGDAAQAALQIPAGPFGPDGHVSATAVFQEMTVWQESVKRVLSIDRLGLLFGSIK
jgi:hypothetical protein